MSKYTEKINELDKRAEILAVRLKEAKVWCQKTVKQLEAIQSEQKQLRV